MNNFKIGPRLFFAFGLLLALAMTLSLIAHRQITAIKDRVVVPAGVWLFRLWGTLNENCACAI